MKDSENITDNTSNKSQGEFYFWIHSAFRKYIEVIMDLILISLVIVNFVFIIKTIYLLGISIYKDTDIPHVISEFLFIFILVEVLRILIIYIESHHVSVDIMVELAIVAILRELILHGVFEIETLKLVGISLLIAILGFLLKFAGLRQCINIKSPTYKPFFKSKKG
ncbi:MAG: phosphate-starvation-inducible PsiE family protein [Thermodesulfovibrionales bacterium]|nr:phosphate-starvation-inducible PsiE family protein [Thermodesulfovibrionales bacterium]